MTETSCIDENEIRKTIATFKPNGELFEVRIHGRRKMTLSGYFRDADKVIENLRLQEKAGRLNGANVFYTLNGVNDLCAAREQQEQFLQIDPMTSDNDIFAYMWLLIDLDPKRPAGTSSTDAQLEKAKVKARAVYSYLLSRGFPRPVVACSGNGFHLQYKIALERNEENKELVKGVLEALALMFNDDDVEVDTAVFNPARICKLYGTKAQKGADTEKQPHRMSKILTVPDELEPIPKAYLESMVDATLPKMEPRARYNNYSPRTFDIEEWMNRYGIGYRKSKSGDYDKFILDTCPFDSSHKAPDSMITRGRNGEIGFKCLHNSCSGYRWRDVRLKYEPDAYDKGDFEQDDGHIDAGYAARKQNRDVETPLDKIEMVDGKPDTSDLDQPAYFSALDILNMPEEKHEFIHTGIAMIDRKMGGLERGAVSVVSGLRGGSKSTWLSQIALNAINEGSKVLFHSFEMKAQTSLNWLLLMAAGKWKTQRSHYSEYSYYIPDPVKKEIAEWMDGKLMIYNNNYGNDYTKIYQQLWHETKENKPDLIILDNLMALDISALDSKGDQYREQTAFVNSLVTLARQSDAHIIFVAHPRKAVGFLRLDDISGSANIANAVTNAFIVHRNNEDFQRLTQQMFKWPSGKEIYKATNVIEVAKDRNFGNQDLFIPLWYEPETKRLKNCETEAVHYGWEKPKDQGTYYKTDKTFEEVTDGKI